MTFRLCGAPLLLLGIAATPWAGLHLAAGVAGAVGVSKKEQAPPPPVWRVDGAV